MVSSLLHTFSSLQPDGGKCFLSRRQLKLEATKSSEVHSNSNCKNQQLFDSKLLPFLCKVPMLYIYQSQSNGDLAIPSLISLRGKTNDEDIFRSLPDFLSIINKEK